MTDPKTATGQAFSRLAVRREGPVVKTYLARMDTMQGAMEVASVQLAFADQPGFFDRYVALLSEAHASLITETTGATVVGHQIQDAPEHERSGHA